MGSALTFKDWKWFNREKGLKGNIFDLLLFLGKDFPTGLLAGGNEGADKGAPVFVVEDDGFAAVSASKNVVDGSLILNPWRAWHDGD